MNVRKKDNFYQILKIKKIVTEIEEEYLINITTKGEKLKGLFENWLTEHNLLVNQACTNRRKGKIKLPANYTLNKGKDIIGHWTKLNGVSTCSLTSLN